MGRMREVTALNIHRRLFYIQRTFAYVILHKSDRRTQVNIIYTIYVMIAHRHKVYQLFNVVQTASLELVITEKLMFRFGLIRNLVPVHVENRKSNNAV